LANSRQNGLKGLYAIFEDLAKTDNAQKVMNTIINYITKLDEPPKRLFLSDCEKWLLNNEYSVKPLSLTEQIQRHLGEAFDHGEIEDSNIDALVHLISTIYYGSSVMTHLTGMNLADYYKSNLDIIFRKD
jgi:type II secretory pathway component PulL